MFELSEEKIDEIIFAMEDQDRDFIINIDTGELVQLDYTKAGALEKDEYIEIPEWKPIDGYRLMENFIAGLRNPIYRQELLDAIASGKKVFRNFKNSLKDNPVLEKKWFVFKERELKHIIYDWYNTNREIKGLEKIRYTIEETEDLVLSDFVFKRWNGDNRKELKELDKKAVKNWHPDLETEAIEKLYDERFSGLPALDDDKSVVFTADTPSNETAGFLWGVHRVKPFYKKDYFEIVQICVAEEYRSLGIAKTLLKHFIQFIGDEYSYPINVTLSYDLLNLVPFFESFGFKTVARTIELFNKKVF